MNRHDIRANESATLSTLKAINSKLFMLEYKGDYGLDELLERGSKDILSTVRFLQKRVRRLTPAINPLPGGFACSAFNTAQAVLSFTAQVSMVLISSSFWSSS